MQEKQENTWICKSLNSKIEWFDSKRLSWEPNGKKNKKREIEWGLYGHLSKSKEEWAWFQKN